MIPFETLTLFSIASLALALAPGPDNIFVLTQSALHRLRAGLLITLGLCTGLLVHTVTVALGVAAIFQTSAAAFTLLKMIGAAYLLYLAWQAWRAGVLTATESASSSLPTRKLYSRGIIMNITNPKVAIFFLAFLPQFADPSRGSVTMQLLQFGALFIIATLLVFGAIALSAGYLGDRLKRSQRAQILMHRIAATVFAALALKLALSER